MGGATVLMASGLELPVQVKGIISDCAFTSPKEVFTSVLKTMYHMPAFPIIQGANFLNKKLAGYGMDECNASREIATTKLPILFIHGGNDDYVPFSMSEQLYEVCPTKKKLIIIPNAYHGLAYPENPTMYIKGIKEFEQELNK